jgi:ABC-2 type transport system ATP-binding protein
LRDLTLTVPAGSICGFLGRNGAGKTTTLKTLIGLTKPGSGSGQIFGMQIDREQDSIRIRRRTGFAAEDKLFPQSVTVGELFNFTRAFYPNWRTDLEQRYLRTFELQVSATAGRLSKGARCGLALLLKCQAGSSISLL